MVDSWMAICPYTNLYCRNFKSKANLKAVRHVVASGAETKHGESRVNLHRPALRSSFASRKSTCVTPEGSAATSN